MAKKTNKVDPKEQDTIFKKMLEDYSNKYNPQNGSAIFSFKNYMDQFIENSKAEGFDMRKINGLISNTIANAAVVNEDSNMLNLIGLIQTGPKSYYSNTVEAQNLIFKARAEINRLREAREDRDWTLQQRGRTAGVQHYNQKIGAQKKRYYDGEITWEQFQKNVKPIFSEMSGFGFTDLVDTWETRIRTENNNKEKRSPAPAIGIDSPRKSEVLRIAETAQSMADVYKWQIENGVELSDELRTIVSSFIQENQGINFNLLNTAEYKEAQPRIDQALSAPGVELSRVQEILEGLSGIKRDPTPPEYFEEKSKILFEIRQQLAERFREILADPNGNRTYQNFTADQSKQWNQALTEIPFANLDANMGRLKKIMHDYNAQVTMDADAARKRQASQFNISNIDVILGTDSKGRNFTREVYLDSLLNLTKNIFETTVFGSRNSLGTYLNKRAEDAGYKGIEDPKAKQLIIDELSHIKNEIIRLTK